MRVLRVSCLLLALLAGTASTVLAEGFALNEWSARGVSLAGGMVGRADDVSALAYNAAGITQLPGTHVMGGLAFIAPLGTIGTEHATGMQYTTTKPSVWLAPHGYASYQLNDNVWLGMGVFSRFGLGNSYSGNWTGRYNLYDVGVQTISFVPTLAYKINDIFSVSVGVEALYASMYMGNKIPTMTAATAPKSFDNDLQLEGTGWGVGAHLGLHMRFNEQWSVGLAYETAVVNEKHADFFVPSNGRTILSLGTGVEWNNWTVDFAYSHLWINPVSYDETDAAGIRGNAITGVTGGKSENVVANIYMFSIGYTF